MAVWLERNLQPRSDEKECNRIDFYVFPEIPRVKSARVEVRKFYEPPAGREGGRVQETLLSYDEKPADFDLAGARSWLESHGWAVRQWPGGMRAWKGGKPRPIRTAGQVRAFRERLNRTAQESNPELWAVLHTLQLEFDC